MKLLKKIQQYQQRRFRVKCIKLASRCGSDAYVVSSNAKRIEHYILTGSLQEDSSPAQNSPSHEKV